jgi:hypothetical protein
MSINTTSNLMLWEILVPTLHGISNTPVKVRFHRVWDAKVKEISGGLSILTPIRGIWLNPDHVEFKERMIPVRIACTEQQINQIADFTLVHYKQEAVMFYLLTDKVFIKNSNNVKN